jgi:60 kDa SS-A/Ro ribonucleoprotein
MKYDTYSTRQTPQSQPVPGRNQVKNNAGGYVFAIDDWRRLDRFLILGSEAPTYYVKAPELTRRNADAVLRCIQEDGVQVVERLTEISRSGRAPKNDPALFVLAMCIKLGNLETRQAAAKALPSVARIGTHLFHFAQFVEQFGGWGKLTRRAVANWYNERPARKLEYQAVKYQQRDGWSHRDLLRLSHPKPPAMLHHLLYGWITKGWPDIGPEPHPDLPLIWAFEQAKRAGEKETIALIREHGLTREMVQTKHLNSLAVWEALLEKMPMTAMVRNLGKMTQVELIAPLSNAARTVRARLNDGEYLRKSRVHPLSVLVALKVYEQGHGIRGSLKWSPVAGVVDALDDAFYLAFGNVEGTDKQHILALDVSGSMASGNIAGLPITPREASAAMAMVTARTEQEYAIVAFQDRIVPISVSPRQRLDDVIRAISNLPFGRTDCAQPMLDAMRRNIQADAFTIYTDNETWCGSVHPFQALQQYRQRIGVDAKLITVGMTSSGFTIADPRDGGMLDVVGFDTATPQVISDFVRD